MLACPWFITVEVTVIFEFLVPLLGPDTVLTIRSGNALIVLESCLLADIPLLSVTVTVKVNVPAVVGVPVITPDPVLRVKPEGRLPDEIDQL